MKSRQTGRFILPFFLCLCLLLCGCSHSRKPTGSGSDSPGSSEQTSEKGSRDNTPRVLTPSADGKDTYICDVATIDASNASEGYVMVAYTGTNPKVKLQITGPDQITYTYNLHGDYEVFPLTSEDGSYKVVVFEHLKDNQYVTVLSREISVKIKNSFGPYLYPNQYVDFNKDSLAVRQAASLAKPADDDLDVVSSVYNYMINNFTYDYDKAENVSPGYIPDLDKEFTSGSGICFDYASLTAAMLRSQGIPTRLEIGYMGAEYHAWISTYIKEKGWINGIIKFDGKKWELLDPTFASTSSSPKDFITDNKKYKTKYVY